MPQTKAPSTRGRPRTITPERIIQAGIEIGLANITFVGVASALGVSHMALYKRIENVEVLKTMVAEAIFNQWEIPPPQNYVDVGLKNYLLVFMTALRELIKTNPGFTPYLIRRVAATSAMIAKIENHHQQISKSFGLSEDQARWINTTIAFHCIAVADTVYSVAGEEPVSNVERAIEEAEMEGEFIRSMQALIIGALIMMEEQSPV